MGWHKLGPGQGFAELSFELCLFCLGPDNAQKTALISLGFYNSILNDSRGTSSCSQEEKPPDSIHKTLEGIKRDFPLLFSQDHGTTSITFSFPFPQSDCCGGFVPSILFPHL